jgi:hypothetical protein
VENSQGLVIALCSCGIVAGLVLLWRGLAAYRSAQRLTGISTSRITSLAAGEVRLVGVVEPEVGTLVSPLQSAACVYYRARIWEGSGDRRVSLLSEERATGFRLRDASGTIRVFPRGARWETLVRFDASSGWSGDDPPGLELNRGATRQPLTEDREAQVAALLTVRQPAGAAGTFDELVVQEQRGSLGAVMGGGQRTRHYREWRLEPGDTVTLVGSALPFGDLDDPAAADRFDPELPADDPEVAMNLAEAREAGILAATPEEAWGNAAIPGFGIGEPTRRPELDPAAKPPDLADASAAVAAEARFEIPPGELVMAAASEDPLAVIAGTPGEARSRADARVLAGLAGAVLAIMSAVALALTLPGALR